MQKKIFKKIQSKIATAIITLSGKNRLCFPVQVRQHSSGSGRGIFAARDIKKDEILIEDFPAVVGPYTLSKALCLKCCSSPVTNENSVLCKCKYFVCKDECCSGSGWHSTEECETLQNIG